MPGDDSLSDLLIRIGAPRPGATVPSVEAVVDGDSLFYGGSLVLDEDQLIAADLDNAAYGRMLHDALFSTPVERAFISARAKVAGRGVVRIRLQIDDEVARLHALRWERTSQIVDGQPAPFATSTTTPFSRFTGLEGASALPLSVSRIRMSVCMSNPANLPEGFAPVRVEDELRQIQQTIAGLPQNRPIDLTIASGNTKLPADLIESLKAAGYRLLEGPLTSDVLLQEMTSAHIVHFLGHGAFRPDPAGGGTAVLYLEDAAGNMAITRDADLLPSLTGSAQLPHLVCLMACETAKRSVVHPLAGLAPKLVKAGVPAVLAMQAKVGMEDASELTRRFYASLFTTGLIDVAANEARSYLFDSRRADWSIPALFMRLRDGRLLAPDPARSALREIVAETTGVALQLPLPIDVVVVGGKPDQAGLERAAEVGEPADDMMDATCGVFVKDDQPQPGFALLFGPQGTAKSTHLRRVAYRTATESLKRDPVVIPLYVDLTEYFGTGSSLGDPFETFLSHALERFWRQLTPERFTELLTSPATPRLRFLIDGNDELSGAQRAEAVRELAAFASEYPWHQYLLAADISYADDLLRAFDGITTSILAIRPIAQTRAEQYLSALQDPRSRDLKLALQNKKLFDLASQPWLLARMMEQARRGILPESRSSVLRRVVDDLLSPMPAARGIRARAADSLYTIAWDMHWRRKTSLALSEAFPILERVRGNRGYTVEEMFEELVNAHLLLMVGPDRLRFAYSSIQDYCCAQAIACMKPVQRDDAIDDITATLGRITRLRWWDETLVILSGLTEIDSNHLLESILYGSSVAEGERVFLAARCVQESGLQHIRPDLLAQITDALIWRTRIQNEPRAALRIRAIETLEGIQAESALPHFACLVADKVRKNYIGVDDFEYSSVRLAATLALIRMDALQNAEFVQQRPQIVKTLTLWRAGDVEALGALLAGSGAESEDLSPSVAAFALGQLRSPRSAELLIAGFGNPDVPSDTRWCITDTLKLIDPALVNAQVLHPFLDDEHLISKRHYRYDQLAYLAGKIKSRDPLVLQFLNNCIKKWHRVSLKGRAIQAIADIYTPADTEEFSRYKTLFEKLAAGDFSGVALKHPVEPGDALYIQRTALEALAQMGDSSTLDFLRSRRQNWPVEVDRQFFLTSEEIYWRLSNTAPAGGAAN